MKSTSAFAALCALASHLVNAHYTFPDLVVGGVTSADWQYIRMTENHYSNGPVTDVTTPEIKCYETDTASATSTATVTAGSTISIKANGAIYHPGYFNVMMSPASGGANVESAGSGTTWFKIWEKLPTKDSTGVLVWDETETEMTFTIPASVPSGQYLIRAEQIALHLAESFQGAQFYLSCAQVNVVGGGSGTPGPLVALPGAYTGYEPGILINIYDGPGTTTYTPPGPPVWTGGSGGSYTPPPPPPATTATSAQPVTTTTTPTAPKTTTTTTTTKAATTTAAPVGGTVAHYGQCGGQGWTGGTVCASPYTCQVSNAYYSQCL